MRSITRKFQLSFIVAVLAIAGLASCSKDNQGEVVVPQITAPGLKNGADTIYVGDSRVLSPTLADVKNPTFQWLVNGVEVSTDSIYTFTATERGNYTISYKVISGNSMALYYYRIKVEGKFENGFFLINEGWYTHEPGDVNFYRNGEDSVYQYVFQRNNPGKTLGTTTEYGAFFNNKLYLVSKQGAFVVADAATMKETGRIDQLPQNGNAFCGINNSTGLISTLDGIYPVNLQTLTVGAKLPGIDGQVGAVQKTSSYIFALTQNDGIVALNQDFSIAQKIGAADIGFAVTPDGTVWAGSGNKLLGINPQNLKIDTVTLPFNVYDTWGYWNAGMLSASTTENAVFIGKSEAWGSGGQQIYKYSVGNPASLQAPFITLPAGTEFYGAGFRNNPNNNTLITLSMKSGYGDNSKQNTLNIYDATSGALKKSVNYVGFFFPAIPAFN
ncbi:hypothetical protein J2T02_003241 [Chitinophaga terrae (ex Kim and Jung 2007)]|uniref:DUF5074 domain-containing protein n=1 Tax=Chitinophaga terrae (ex Kim and Jung 2007) TaxID=408074 RepID=UPI00278799A3|nr:DUF5074 domain-containing protein [Chitinophaga terrae (ex Kim and Jung 2007)]MDQ0108119.1 hypothetical protein [Chitinophaga terrae (ex Kim and Jung 2007)]